MIIEACQVYLIERVTQTRILTLCSPKISRPPLKIVILWSFSIRLPDYQSQNAGDFLVAAIPATLVHCKPVFSVHPVGSV